jgi:hypothetical protein
MIKAVSRYLGEGNAGPLRFFMKAILAIAISMGLGCAGAQKKPASYHFTGCKVTQSWVDEQGNQRRDCDCKNGREVGWDAKTRLRIIRCE